MFLNDCVGNEEGWSVFSFCWIKKQILKPLPFKNTRIFLFVVLCVINVLCIIISSSANRSILSWLPVCRSHSNLFLETTCFPKIDVYSCFFVKHNNAHVYSHFGCGLEKGLLSKGFIATECFISIIQTKHCQPSSRKRTDSSIPYCHFSNPEKATLQSKANRLADSKGSPTCYIKYNVPLRNYVGRDSIGFRKKMIKHGARSMGSKSIEFAIAEINCDKKLGLRFRSNSNGLHTPSSLPGTSVRQDSTPWRLPRGWQHSQTWLWPLRTRTLTITKLCEFPVSGWGLVVPGPETAQAPHPRERRDPGRKICLNPTLHFFGGGWRSKSGGATDKGWCGIPSTLTLSPP